MTSNFPFSAIVGQETMKQALILTAIDPSIGGVLVFGERGTGKSTIVRSLTALLPEINAIKGCPYNCYEANTGCLFCETQKNGRIFQINSKITLVKNQVVKK